MVVVAAEAVAAATKLFLRYGQRRSFLKLSSRLFLFIEIKFLLHSPIVLPIPN